LKLLLCLFSIAFTVFAKGQSFKLLGNVYDFESKEPLEAVSVFCSCGEITITDSVGHYTLQVTNKDSIWFSYLGKNTVKYPVDTITNTSSFDVGLHLNVSWLPEVRVRNRSYKQDSVQNRQDYSKIFDYKKPGLKLSSRPSSSYVPGSVTAGLDLDELINIFRFKRNRQLLSFQQRLILEEQEKYVTRRFNKRFVTALTTLHPPDLDTFMLEYKPSYEALLLMNELELGYYIQQGYKQFMARRKRF
jgi:hypothetical protein